MVTIIGYGSANIIASQEGNGNYNAATDVLQSLTVHKAPLSIVAESYTKVYGGDDPTFDYLCIPVNLFGDDVLSGSLTRSSGEDVIEGGYVIEQGTLTAGDNYIITFIPGTLTVNKTELTLTLPDYFVIRFCDPLPEIIITVDGFVFTDKTTLDYSIGYDLFKDDIFFTSVTEPGVYEIVPKIDPELQNYYVTPVSGILYVNPFGPGTKKLRSYLNCVKRDGAAYIAQFRYENDNATPVFVPKGDDNYILTIDGPVYPESLPELFLTGAHTFDVEFDGTKISWYLSSYESVHKSSVVSDASFKSKKCKKSGFAEDPFENIIDNEIKVYPNPVGDRFYINMVYESISGVDVMIIDMQGRIHPVSWKPTLNRLEVDASKLVPGPYVIKVRVESTLRNFMIIKQ